MLEADLHSHTLFNFCGLHTTLEMITFARHLGIKALAITEHGPWVAGKVNQTFYKRFQNPFSDLIFFKGMECNLGDKKGEIDLPDRSKRYLDLILLGIHLNVPRGLGKEHYTEYLIAAIENNPGIDIITHPNDPDYPVDLKALAKVAKHYGIALEINNSKLAQDIVSVEEMKELATICIKEGCQVAVNSDAHVVNELGDDRHISPWLSQLSFPSELWINKDAQSAYRFVEQRKNTKR